MKRPKSSGGNVCGQLRDGSCSANERCKMLLICTGFNALMDSWLRMQCAHRLSQRDSLEMMLLTPFSPVLPHDKNSLLNQARKQEEKTVLSKAKLTDASTFPDISSNCNFQEANLKLKHTDTYIKTKTNNKPKPALNIKSNSNHQNPNHKILLNVT